MTINYKEKAKKLISEWKKDNYAFGLGVLHRVGEFSLKADDTTMLVVSGLGTEKWINPVVKEIKDSLRKKNIEIISIIRGAEANTPREDVYRIANQIGKKKPGSIIAIGGGSTIDAVKAAAVLCTLESDDLESYFGMGLVSERAIKENKKIPIVIAVQTAASSGAHLTKYSNITNPLTGQKKLIIDDSIIPPMAVFDYCTTLGAPYAIKVDGALDGIAHCIEVVCGSTGKPFFEKTMEIAESGINLIVKNLSESLERPMDSDIAENIGLGTDLGGYAIMVGGTNYGHLFSFSLVNKLTHGRACAIADPYVLVFFALAIEPQLRLLGRIFKENGYISEEIENKHGRELSLTVCRGIIKFLKRIEFPTTFGDVGVWIILTGKGSLDAAKNPQLWSKLEQAPVSLIVRDTNGDVNEKLTKNNIDVYMGALIDAIISGDLNMIKNIP